jgi:hypothetical protein
LSLNLNFNCRSSDTPGNERAAMFLHENERLIGLEMNALSKDHELCHVITQAVRVKMIITSGQSEQNVSTWIDHIERLTGLGIFRAGGDAPYPHTFFPMAQQFLAETPKLS